MDVRMDGRKALVTGGSLGIGRAIGKAFATSGADVALVARRQEVLDEAKAEIDAVASTTVRTYACDVRDPAQINDLFAQVTRDFGQLDVLVNNAGTSATNAFVDISDEDWQHDFDLKLFAAIRLARHALPGMMERRWGRIINVLNIGAKTPGARTAPTSVTRAAGMALTKVLAGEGAPHNVLVNALCTGWIVSDQWERRHEREGSNESFEDYLAKLGKAIPIGRYGEAEEFANMACFLASEQGSYITGTAINIDGGKSPAV